MTYGMCVTCVWPLSVLGSKMSSSDETGRDPMQVRLPIHKTEAGLDSQWGSYGDLCLQLLGRRAGFYSLRNMGSELGEKDRMAGRIC